MNKTECIICKKPATRSGELTVALEEWIGRSRPTGTTVGLCDQHTHKIFPLIILNNPCIEEFVI